MNKDLYETIKHLLTQNETLIVAIEGPCTSGKTTLSVELEKNFDCNVIHMDDFFLPFELRNEKRLNEIGGNIDYVRFKTEVADKLHSVSPFTYGKFNCSKGKITDNISVIPKKLTIVEGVYSMHPYFGNIYNLRIFLDISENTKLSRLKKRSPEKLERFIKDWIPKEDSYFKEFRIIEKCDIIITNN